MAGFDAMKTPPVPVSEPIELNIDPAEPTVIHHGLGRAVAGWQILYADAPIQLYAAGDSDPANVLTLRATNRATVRLVLWA